MKKGKKNVHKRSGVRQFRWLEQKSIVTEKNSFQKIVHKLNHSSVVNETFYVKSDEW